jgi:hypothetical protein
MICKKLTSLAIATVIGATLIAAPAQAQFGGGGFGVAHVGGFGGGFRGGFVRGPGWGGGFVRGPGWGGRRAFGFGGPFLGVGLGLGAIAASSSCWTWVPTAFGWRRVWACDSGWGPGWGGPGWGW